MNGTVAQLIDLVGMAVTMSDQLHADGFRHRR
jgi:hypothetical protein